TGDQADDAIEVIDHGDGNIDLVTENGTETFTAISTVQIDTQAGNDSIQFVLDPADSSSSMAVLRVSSGADNDVVTVGGPISDLQPAIRNEQLDYQFDLGTGDDALSIGIRQFDAIDVGVIAADGNDNVALG